MKKAGVVIGAVIFGLFIILTMAYAADKFAYVDLSRAFSEYSKTKDYDKVLSDKQGVYDTERNKKVDDLKQLQSKIELLSDKEKAAKQPELEKKIKILQDFDRQQQTDLRKDQDERMKEILKDIETTVKTFSEKESYTLVFNDRVLVYQNKNLDITDKIIQLLNKGYKSK